MVETMYFDAASATPLNPVAREALTAALDEGWADPSRLYTQARRARQLFDASRGVVAEILGVRPENTMFTPSGAAATYSAVCGVGGSQRDSTVVHSGVEHSAVLHAAQWREVRGGRTVSVPVDAVGCVDVDTFARQVRTPDVVLAALIAASHEVGTLQPIHEVASVCEDAGVPLYVDAAALMGQSDLPSGWKLLSGSARKWGGPAGVGILAIAPSVRWSSPWPGDPAEIWKEPGSLNLPMVVAAAAGLRARAETMQVDAAHMRALIARLRRELPQRIRDVALLGDPANCAPHILSFSCGDVDSEALVQALNVYGVAVSSGSFCTSAAIEPHHVLVAMGAPTRGVLRVSVHPGTTSEDVDRFLTVLPEAIASLR